jgi:hypothetical protein
MNPNLNPNILMRPVILLSALSFLLAFSFASCSKKTEDLQLENISDYMPLATGKVFTYRLDSTVFTNFGRNTEIHSYDERHVIDANFTDNLGRPSYRVFRFIRDTAGTKPWTPSGTYAITVNQQSVEYSQDNLRTLRLAAPIRIDFAWKGNRFLPNEPYTGLFSFSNDDYMNEWEFIYSGIGESFRIKNKTVSDVITIQHVDESINVPISSPTAYASINYSVDKFAKGIGLVYQELIMWEYQPNPSGPSGYKTGFGIKRSLVDHN